MKEFRKCFLYGFFLIRVFDNGFKPLHRMRNKGSLDLLHEALILVVSDYTKEILEKRLKWPSRSEVGLPEHRQQSHAFSFPRQSTRLISRKHFGDTIHKLGHEFQRNRTAHKSKPPIPPRTEQKRQVHSENVTSKKWTASREKTVAGTTRVR